MQSAELFAGCGGLALGMSHAGFRHQYMAEFDHDAVATVLHNKAKLIHAGSGECLGGRQFEHLEVLVFMARPGREAVREWPVRAQTFER